MADNVDAAPEEVTPPVAAPVVEAAAAPVERHEEEFVPVVEDVPEKSAAEREQEALDAERKAGADALALVALEERVEVGSTFTRTAFGWSVKIMYGGALRLCGDGDTLHTALLNAGV